MRVADRILIAWPDPGTVDGAFAYDIANLYAERRDRILGLLRLKGGLITRQRNEIITTFLQTQAQWLLTIDSDQRISIPTFDKLVDAAHDRDRPVISGLVFAAYQGDLYPTPVPTIYRNAPDGFFAPIHDYPTDQLIQVDSVGGGCLLIHRTVLETIRDSADPALGGAWCWYQDGPVDGKWLSEDHYLARQITSHGYPIHAHTGAILPHHKSYWLTDRHHGKEQP